MAPIVPIVPSLSFKTTRLAEEWAVTHPDLRKQVYGLAEFAVRELGKSNLTITCVARTPDENMAVGGIPNSLHMAIPIRAVDIRRRIFTDDEVQRLQAYWIQARPSQAFDFVDEPKKHHIHLEVELTWA